jgi:tRNA(Ile)-lysidine synthase TilS/MesJ
MKEIGVPYFLEQDAIVERAKDCMQKNSICSFCSRMKRGIIYSCAKREGYNVIALGQHLDDLAESFVMSSFFNGLLRTMKANYYVKDHDLRVIRPLAYCREALFKEMATKENLPLITDNCPACFSAPKERHRTKLMLAAQENMHPNIYQSILATMMPLMKGNSKDLLA